MFLFFIAFVVILQTKIKEEAIWNQNWLSTIR